MVRFIKAVNRAILKEKITPYNINFNGDPNSLEVAEPEYFFYRNDTEFVENEKGFIKALPISDTINYSKTGRLDCIQEWFYNSKKTN